jgi:hypothetical protein
MYSMNVCENAVPWWFGARPGAKNNQERSSLHDCADLVRKIGCDHETALRNILFRFENLTVDQVMKSIGYKAIIC